MGPWCYPDHNIPETDIRAEAEAEFSEADVEAILDKYQEFCAQFSILEEAMKTASKALSNLSVEVYQRVMTEASKEKEHER